MTDSPEDELLRSALTPIDEPAGSVAGWEDVVARVGRRRRRRQAARVASPVVAIALIVGVIGVAATRGRDDVTQVETGVTEAPDGSEGALPSDTETVLVISDGVTGAQVIDVDRQVAKHVELPGAAPGEFKVRLAKVGDRIVYPGRPGTFALPLNLEGRPFFLGDSIDFLAAGDDENVWLFTGEEPGKTELGIPLLARRVGVGPGSSGEIGPFPVPPVDGLDHQASAFVEAATSDQLLLQLPDVERDYAGLPGRKLWRPSESPLAETEIDVDGYCAAATSQDGNLFLPGELDGGCLGLFRVNADGEVTRALAAPDRHLGIFSKVAPSPDGGLVAVSLSVDRSEGSVAVADLETGEFRTVTRFDGSVNYSWSPDGSKLFVTRPDPSVQKATTIVAFDVESGETTQFDIPVSVTGDPIALRANEIDLGPAAKSCSVLASVLKSLPPAACYLREEAAEAAPLTTLDDGVPPPDAMTGTLPDGRQWFLWPATSWGLCVEIGGTDLGCDPSGPVIAPTADPATPRLAVVEGPSGELGYGFLPEGAATVAFELAGGDRSQNGSVNSATRAWALPINPGAEIVSVLYLDAGGREVRRFAFGAGTP